MLGDVNFQQCFAGFKTQLVDGGCKLLLIKLRVQIQTHSCKKYYSKLLIQTDVFTKIFQTHFRQNRFFSKDFFIKMYLYSNMLNAQDSMKLDNLSLSLTQMKSFYFHYTWTQFWHILMTMHYLYDLQAITFLESNQFWQKRI